MKRYFYTEPSAQTLYFVPENTFCATSNRGGSSSDYEEEDENDIFDD